MARFFKKRDQNRGLPPGSLVFIGERKVEKTLVSVIDYDRDKVTSYPLEDIREAAEYRNTPGITWINVDGIHDTELIRHLGDSFDLHPLLLEDILNTGQRPKMTDYDSYLYIVLKMLRYDEDTGRIKSEQVSIVQGEHYLVTLQEQPGDVFDPVRERISKAKGRIRTAGSDYLAYALLDTVIDNYIYIIERIGENVEALEEKVALLTNRQLPKEINSLKQEIHFLRKSIRPAHEAVMKLAKQESGLIQESTRPFLKDLLDLAVHAVETADIYSDLLSDHFNTYNALVSNRMNDIMKVLTIIATLFIPVTFIAGIYGMNFDFMPELAWKHGYLAVLAVMAGIIITMLYYFKRKQWF